MNQAPFANSENRVNACGSAHSAATRPSVPASTARTWLPHRPCAVVYSVTLSPRTASTPRPSVAAYTAPSVPVVSARTRAPSCTTCSVPRSYQPSARAVPTHTPPCGRGASATTPPRSGPTSTFVQRPSRSRKASPSARPT
ncbi:MAG: hypothetical protein H6704_09015 [Myxococcales bacterium]|nr:hypothetical protein [Myxococcales bacterium]